MQAMANSICGIDYTAMCEEQPYRSRAQCGVGATEVYPGPAITTSSIGSAQDDDQLRSEVVDGRPHKGRLIDPSSAFANQLL